MIQLRHDATVPRAFRTQFQLFNCDCVRGMAGLADESADLVVTSPPYNLGIKYGKYNDRQARSDYLEWSCKWLSQVQRILKPKGSFFLNVGAAPSNPLLPHELVLRGTDYFILQNTFHWVKSITVRTAQQETVSVGHFKPINSRRYVTDCHEYVFHFTKTGDAPLNRLALGVPYVDKTNVARWGHTRGHDTRCRGNNWFIPYKTIQSRDKERPHPATFPVELAEWCIRLCVSNNNAVMLDPFLGIGHSAMAAKRCDLASFIGFEIDCDYFRTAREHVQL